MKFLQSVALVACSRKRGPLAGLVRKLVDSDYNEESFFVRQAYFLGANDPYNVLKTALKAEINEEGWGTLNSDTSRPLTNLPPEG
jgi:adenine-specific DNA-methyltransferase